MEDFSKEQIEYIKKALSDELNLLLKDIEKDYISKKMVKEMLEHTKKTKSNIKDRNKLLYLDGMIFGFEEILKTNLEEENNTFE